MQGFPQRPHPGFPRSIPGVEVPGHPVQPTTATEMEAPHRRQPGDVSRDGLESHLPGWESHVLVVEDLSPASRVRQRGPEPLRSVQQRRQPVPESIQGVIGTLGGEVITSCDGVNPMPRDQVHRSSQAGTDIVEIDGTL